MEPPHAAVIRVVAIRCHSDLFDGEAFADALVLALAPGDPAAIEWRMVEPGDDAPESGRAPITSVRLAPSPCDATARELAYAILRPGRGWVTGRVALADVPRADRPGIAARAIAERLRTPPVPEAPNVTWSPPTSRPDADGRRDDSSPTSAPNGDDTDDSSTTPAPSTPLTLEFAARIGAGATTSSAPFGHAPNPFGFGIGGRAGVSFRSVYVGASAIDYFGSTDGYYFEGGTAASSVLLGVDVGYGFTVGAWTVRPQVGLGEDILRLGSLAGFTGQTLHSVYIEPALVAHARLRLFTFGADVSLPVMPQMPSQLSVDDRAFFTVGIAVHLELGVTF
jgi:hypothetical protein